MNFFDESEFIRMQTHKEDACVSVKYLTPYRAKIKGLKCPVHKRVAIIEQAHNYEQYDDGNYTRLYFSNSCCSRFETDIIAILEVNFPEYSSHRVYRHDKV